MRTPLRVKVKPGSPRNRIRGFDPRGTLRVEIQAPPQEGRANRELIRFLARKLELPQDAIILKAGAKSREKLLLIEGLGFQTLRER